MNKNNFSGLEKCSRCGLCQAYCPLFLATGKEPLLARGKVELLENLNTGNLDWNDKIAEMFSTCLLCGSCTENCPNGVQPDQGVMAARKRLVLDRGLPSIEKNAFEQLLKYNGKLNLAGQLMLLYQDSQCRELVQSTKISGQFSLQFAGKPFPKIVPSYHPVENPKLKVGYFTGCVTNLINHNVVDSILKVLRANQVEVIIPEQCCCGAPAFSWGDFETGRFLGEQNVKEFYHLKADYIITDCAHCLSTWLNYPEFLESDEASQLLPKIMDINRFLVEVLDIKLNPRNLSIPITYHDPCHLKRTQGGRTAPRELLRRLSPAFEFREMDLADRCCGAGCFFNLSHYHLSQLIAAPKIKSVQDNGAKIVATACPSCILQLSHSLNRQNSDIQVKHVMELAAECL